MDGHVKKDIYFIADVRLFNMDILEMLLKVSPNILALWKRALPC